MEHLNIFVAQVAVLLLPGIIWARLDTRYAAKEKASEFDFVLRALVYGLVSYAFTFVMFSVCGFPFAIVDFNAATQSNVITKQIGLEVLAATGTGLLLAVGWIYAANQKWLSRFLQKIGATKRYGDEDVWDYTFNSPLNAVRYINFRDFDKKIVYAGWVSAFSEAENIRELTLFDVEIYDFEGKFMFGVPLLYLARKPDDIHIEFPLT